MRHLTDSEFLEYTRADDIGTCVKTALIKPGVTVTVWSNTQGAVMAGDWISPQIGYFLYLDVEGKESWFPSYFATMEDALKVLERFEMIANM